MSCFDHKMLCEKLIFFGTYAIAITALMHSLQI